MRWCIIQRETAERIVGIDRYVDYVYNTYYCVYLYRFQDLERRVGMSNQHQYRAVATYAMTLNETKQPVYLSLSAASRLLGVHSTTLRRWADAGSIPVYVTPGGHRRFARADIEALVSTHMPTSEQSLVNTLAERAWDQARTDLERVEQQPAWLKNLGDEERDTWRRVSQQLMGIVLRYVSTQETDESLLEQAHAIGLDYARNARRVGMPLTMALEAALFFRDSLVSAAMDLPEPTNSRHEHHHNTRLLNRISRVLNVVQLAVAAGYEGAIS